MLDTSPADQTTARARGGWPRRGRCGLIGAALVMGVLLSCRIAAAQSYRTLDEIETLLQDAAAAYPDLCEYVDVGQSMGGRDIVALHISDNFQLEEDEPEFKYVSTMHGDEWTGNEMMLYLIDHLLSQYGTDPQATTLVNELDIWIIPVMNPDGFDRLSPRRYNNNNSDLNRDFPDPYTSPSNTTAGREPETGAIMNWSFGESFTLSANLHTGALVCNYPMDTNAQDADVYTASPDDDFYFYACTEFTLRNTPMRNSSAFTNGMTNGADWYSVRGGMQDWNYRWLGDFEITLELSNTKIPSATQIPAFWADNQAAMLRYMELTLIGVRGLVTDGDGNPLSCRISVDDRAFDVFTDPDVGDYHRLLMPGVYDLTFDCGADGTATRENVIVHDGEATRLHVSFDPLPPVAFDKHVDMIQGDSLVIELPATDPNDDALSYVIHELPAHGVLSDPLGDVIFIVPYVLIGGGSSVIYTPDANHLGSDAFTFSANDGGIPPTGGQSNVATVYIDVSPAPPEVVEAELPQGVDGQPYGPVQLSATGGDLPLTWSLPSDGAGYDDQNLGANGYAATGTDADFNGDDTFWLVNLPFSFPFYDQSYTQVQVSDNGFLMFNSTFVGLQVYSNSVTKLADNVMIAPLYDDLVTNQSGNDIYIDSAVAGQITIRWDAYRWNTTSPVRFAVTLEESGRITFHYGAGNAGLSPTIGISAGDGTHYQTAAYNGNSSLNLVNSLQFTPPHSLPDGMTLSAAGELSGTPTETGTFDFSVLVSDDQGREDDGQLTLVINATIPADCDADGDGDVDLDDVMQWQRCFGQPAVGNCGSSFEFTTNGVIGLDDYDWLVYQLNASGPQ